MFARINFLLGLGLLIQITFYFAGVYLLIPPLSAVAPSLVKPAAGIAILAAVGVTVQLLSMAMSSFRGIALYEKGERPGTLAVLSQAVMAIGHAVAVYSATGLLRDGEPIGDARMLVIAAIYLAGTVLALNEWRQRKLARS